MRRVSAVVMFAVLTTGCTVTTDGSAEPAPTLGRAPKPVASGDLTGLLLSTGELSAITGAGGLKIVTSGDHMYHGRIVDNDCVALLWPALQEVYAGTGWLGVQRQDLRENKDDYHHIVEQAVVAFRDAGAANDAYQNQVTGWASCDNRTITDEFVDDPDDAVYTWGLGATSEHDGILTMLRTQEGGQGWACLRALAARNNVVIDVSTCAADTRDQAVSVVDKIAEKIAAAE